MFHERMLYTSSYVSEPTGPLHSRIDAAVYASAKEQGRMDDPSVRELVGEARMLELVSQEMSARVTDRIRSGHLSDQVAALARLCKGPNQSRIATSPSRRPDRRGRHGRTTAPPP